MSAPGLWRVLDVVLHTDAQHGRRPLKRFERASIGQPSAVAVTGRRQTSFFGTVFSINASTSSRRGPSGPART